MEGDFRLEMAAICWESRGRPFHCLQNVGRLNDDGLGLIMLRPDGVAALDAFMVAMRRLDSVKRPFVASIDSACHGQC